MKILVSFILAILLIFSCKSDKQIQTPVITSEAEQLYIEVMKIHDDVMPLMSNIHRQKRQLKTIIANDSLHLDSNLIEQNQITALQLADDKMMDWMAAFDASSKNRSDSTTISYLKNQKTIISEVSQLIHSSLNSGKKLLDK